MVPVSIAENGTHHTNQRGILWTFFLMQRTMTQTMHRGRTTITRRTPITPDRCLACLKEKEATTGQELSCLKTEVWVQTILLLRQLPKALQLNSMGNHSPTRVSTLTNLQGHQCIRILTCRRALVQRGSQAGKTSTRTQSRLHLQKSIPYLCRRCQFHSILLERSRHPSPSLTNLCISWTHLRTTTYQRTVKPWEAMFRLRAGQAVWLPYTQHSSSIQAPSVRLFSQSSPSMVESSHPERCRNTKPVATITLHSQGMTIRMLSPPIIR